MDFSAFWYPGRSIALIRFSVKLIRDISKKYAWV